MGTYRRLIDKRHRTRYFNVVVFGAFSAFSVKTGDVSSLAKWLDRSRRYKVWKYMNVYNDERKFVVRVYNGLGTIMKKSEK